MSFHVVPDRQPLGVFNAQVTRDGSALERDGDPFFAANRLPESVPSDEGALFEVEFADGVWMLARAPDLTFHS